MGYCLGASSSEKKNQSDTLRKDIKSHGYPEKAVKQCGMRYMGPMFYENWLNGPDLDENGNCISTDIEYAQVLVFALVIDRLDSGSLRIFELRE